VIVLGAGPGGSTAANLLARRGHRVLVLEREIFPRFHIGESLLPFSTPLFEKLGVLDEMRRSYQRKFGALFTEVGEESCRKVVFADGLVPGHALAFHARRAELDQLLADAACRAGAEIRFGWRAEDVLRDGERVAGVLASDGDGNIHEIPCRAVVDATGRAAILGRKAGAVVPEPALRRGALFAHFRDVARDPEETDGDLRTVVFATGWWWLIPFSDGTWSVGAVSSAFPPGATIEERFDRLASATPGIGDRLAGARRVGPVRSESDFSYSVKKVAGDGWLAVGDAAGFLDPVFSTGVFLAMATAERAAETLAPLLDRGGPIHARDLAGYERFVRRGFRRFRRYVVGFYNRGFRETFYQTPPVAAFYSAVTSVLAGGIFLRSPRVRIWNEIFLAVAAWRMRRHSAMEVAP